jgi:hypothetical protein
MKLLATQKEYEELIGRVPTTAVIPDKVVIYFTASWCGACKRLDTTAIEAAFPGVEFLKCDVDVNDYTAGYCNVRSIPAFLVVKNRAVTGPLQSSDTGAVVKWIAASL